MRAHTAADTPQGKVQWVPIYQEKSCEEQYEPFSLLNRVEYHFQEKEAGAPTLDELWEFCDAISSLNAHYAL